MSWRDKGWEKHVADETLQENGVSVCHVNWFDMVKDISSQNSMQMLFYIFFFSWLVHYVSHHWTGFIVIHLLTLYWMVSWWALWNCFSMHIFAVVVFFVLLRLLQPFIQVVGIVLQSISFLLLLFWGVHVKFVHNNFWQNCMFFLPIFDSVNIYAK